LFCYLFLNLIFPVFFPINIRVLYLILIFFPQQLGEIDPFFIGQHFHHLGNRWNLYDSDGVPLQIYFNQSILNPLITFGWPRLRHYYRWIGVKRLAFFYFGEDSFQLVVCERDGELTPDTFPPFHSLSGNNNEYLSFRIVINIFNVISAKLVSSFVLITKIILEPYFNFSIYSISVTTTWLI
jgi:hypothetical protein